MSIEEAIKVVEKVKSKKKMITPARYKVIFVNDNYTTFEFVINVLMIIFKKTETEAIEITQKIHNEGSAVIAVYSQEIAITKKNIVDHNAKIHHYPLVCLVEKE